MSVAFACKNSGAGTLGRMAIEPEDLKAIEVPCGGRVDVIHLLRAVEQGAQRVLVLTCRPGVCRSIEGYCHAERKVARANALLQEVGSSARVEAHAIAANEPGLLARILGEGDRPAAEGDTEG